MSNISSPFGQNEWLVEEMYRKFRDDPSSVDPSWHEFLVDYNPEPTGDSVLAAPASTDGPSAPAPAAPQTAQPALPA
ncbi:2-oxoglutarate dehydrogenase E1 subunit family protein, partial [Mycobacterium avium]